ncbi:6-phosphogluconolactonase-like [Amphibalanus amphitrite]|uniref:6-phosphogluconolactonase-like n=1 Tax=Amphibalanus amphitrite TaxID=1232801 RepID=UPI001C902FFC|nr:6-phosphogluconolactonase-like [Amphibalanus amphitrite]XP_043217864.1 6-phosphogluconolactonase-like [Amphibalanus amphitrite]XP_043217865.1 6-phosphogluconolactonase-like [Amphibalanus amphitrite]XP_043217866.1 6-phosphogluconolactonase-like [Amphibalanus amphitrite]XP_043217867.1 6-phosphogluconolactonase-like [Amphibalanus amphitrite]XP_043217868.1 6-phosphogluconolactonase-like [Amphibalanus amphitrite]
MGKEEVIVKETVEDVTKELASLVEKEANEAIQSRGKFIIGLSGGSLVNFLAAGLPTISTDWSLWHVLFCDERVVPFNSDDSTFGVYRRQLKSNGGALPLTESQFLCVDPGLDADTAAADYAAKVSALLGPGRAPRCDLLLLGMGPDGHTCSLFPGHALLSVTDRAVAAITDSPKPPPARVTLTLPAVNAARAAVFAMAGAGKADMVRRVLRDREPLPAALVQPTDGRLVWILDQAAAAKL